MPSPVGAVNGPPATAGQPAVHAGSFEGVRSVLMTHSGLVLNLGAPTAADWDDPAQAPKALEVYIHRLPGKRDVDFHHPTWIRGAECRLRLRP